MKMPYAALRTGEYYLIVCDGYPVRSPLGRPYRTGYRLLAEDLCDDLAHGGLSVASGVSLGVLHGAYLDRGGSMPRAQLADDLVLRYDRRLDFALARPQERTAEAMMSAWFGPAPALEIVAAWTQAASVRQLIAAAAAADATGSMLVAYRLLRSELPAPRLAAGVRKYERDHGDSVAELTVILETARRYAQVPDEPELLTDRPGNGEAGERKPGVSGGVGARPAPHGKPSTKQ